MDESHLVRPVDVNGVNKSAGEAYHLLYSQVYGLHACSLRLTNVYGPRQLIKHKNVYEYLENAIDKCQDVANIIEAVVVENV